MAKSISVSDLDIYYGDFHAVHDVNLAYDAATGETVWASSTETSDEDGFADAQIDRDVAHRARLRRDRRVPQERAAPHRPSRRTWHW